MNRYSAVRNVCFSCPDIDRLITHAEAVRGINDQLRELAEVYGQEADDLESEVASLERTVDDLNRIIDGLRDELSNYKELQ